MSRFHKVIAVCGKTVSVIDVDDHEREVSLLALDGPPPQVGDWLVVHSGYAIGRADAAEVELVAAELRAARG